jgi:hypothetical protein
MNEVAESGEKRRRILDVQFTTNGGLFIDRIEFTYFTWGFWWVLSGHDELGGPPPICGRGHTLAEAWEQVIPQAVLVGECKECGCITRGECDNCAARQLLAPSVRCTDCGQSKKNMYVLLCGHSMCRHCAAQRKIVKKCCEDWRECPTCKASFRLCQGLRELPVERWDEDEEQCTDCEEELGEGEDL